jgi:hypothetical protein
MDSNTQSEPGLSTGTMSVVLIGGTKKDYIKAQDKFGELGIDIPWHYESDKSNSITIPKGCEGIVAYRKISHKRLRDIVIQANGMGLPWTMVDIGSSARDRLMDLRQRAGFTKLPVCSPEPCPSIPEPIKAESITEEVKTMEEENRETAPEVSDNQPAATDPPIVEEPPVEQKTAIVAVTPTQSPPPLSIIRAKLAIRDLLQGGPAAAPDLSETISGQRNNSTVGRAIKELIAKNEIYISRMEYRPEGGGQPARILELVRKKPERKKPVTKKVFKRTPVVATPPQPPAPVVHAATDLREYFLIRLQEKMKDPETADKIILVLLQNGLLNT